jgi:hypothetical protein
MAEGFVRPADDVSGASAQALTGGLSRGTHGKGGNSGDPHHGIYFVAVLPEQIEELGKHNSPGGVKDKADEDRHDPPGTVSSGKAGKTDKQIVHKTGNLTPRIVGDRLSSEPFFPFGYTVERINKQMVLETPCQAGLFFPSGKGRTGKKNLCFPVIKASL